MGGKTDWLQLAMFLPKDGASNFVKILEIREISVPLQGKVANAVIDFDSHDVSLVAVITDQVRNGRPVAGLGFNSIGRFAQGGILNDRILPRLRSVPVEDLMTEDGSFDCASVLKIAIRNEKPGGHGDRAAAAAAVELAFWDLNAKLQDEPACQTIARAFGRTASTSATVYAAGGYYHPEDGLHRLQDELRGYRENGFEAFKIKIGGVTLEHDLRRIDTALEICGSGARLSVDANGRFDVQQALTYARSLTPYALRWFEEPCDPLDFASNSQVIAEYDGAIATGENLFSVPDVNNLLNFGGMRADRDVFQMDAGLSYGLTEFGRIIDLMERRGYDRRFSFPHGGHLINLHIVLGMNLGGCEAYPSVFQPFGGYSPECCVQSGCISAGERPGFGLEGKPELAPYIARILD